MIPAGGLQGRIGKARGSITRGVSDDFCPKLVPGPYTQPEWRVRGSPNESRRSVAEKKSLFSSVIRSRSTIPAVHRETAGLVPSSRMGGGGGTFGNVSPLPLSRSVLGPSNGRVEAWQGKVVVEHVRWLTSLLSSRSAPPDSDRSARKMPRPNRALQSSCFRHWGCLRVSIATATTNTRFVKCACLA